MVKLTLKEKFAFKFILNDKVFQRWYGRFISFGIDYWRMKRVVERVDNWLDWCKQWKQEGDSVRRKALSALETGYLNKARELFHEAAACYHIGQHIFFVDEIQKEESQHFARISYQEAINLYPENDKPVKIEIPYKNTKINGYLRIAEKPDAPLIIFVNGMDNIKEAEGHAMGNMYRNSGFNFFTFDGPGQGEMWQTMKFDGRKYHKAVSAVIDWFEKQELGMNMNKLALVGYSLGGYLAPMCASKDNRVKCVVGNSGLVFIGGIEGLKKLNPIWQRGVTYMTGKKSLKDSVDQFNWDIHDSPPLKIPLLFYHAGKDEVMPSPSLHAKKMMDWAQGPKTLKFYEDGEHCTQNYLDEVFPEIIDWLWNELNSI